jgi:hypothetical protein
MAVMAVFMTIFTGAVVSMARTTTKVEAVTSSTAQVNNAFLRLDKLVRYAEAITTVGPATGGSGSSYVELASLDSASSQETCTQLRVDVGTQKLQLRTWTVTGPTTYSALTGWATLASNIVPQDATGAVYPPFAVPPSLVAATVYQRLTITLVAGTSGPSSTSRTRTSFTFTALNSNASDATNPAKCQQLPSTVYRP